MSRQILYWLYISCKRIMRTPFFWFFSAVLLILAALFERVEEEDNGKIAIALYGGESEWNSSVIDLLMEQDGSFEFYKCDTKRQLEEDVAANRAECGYSFPENLYELLKKHDYKDSICVTISPATVTDELVSETIFAALFQVLGRELLNDYVDEGAAFEEARVAEQNLWAVVEPLYDRYLIDGSTFRFEYKTIDGGAEIEPEMKVNFPVRGIGAVYVMVMGLAAAVTAAQDEERGFYAVADKRQRRKYQLITISSMVALALITVFLCILQSDEGKTIIAEVIELMQYGILTILFSFAVMIWVKKSLIIAGLIPFFILGSLVVCPIFVDLSVVVPALKGLRWLFLPWYFIR